MSAKDVWDSADTIFFARELEHVLATSKDVIYADLKFREFIPVNREGGDAVQVITYESYDDTGSAKFIGDASEDAPRVDTKGTEQSHYVKSLADSFGFSLQDIRSARATGKPLEARKLNAAKRAIEELLDETSANGSADYGFEGFLNLSAVTVIDNDNNGTGSSRAFADKTPDQIIADFATATGTAFNASNGKEAGPFRFILPLTQYNSLASTRLTDTGQSLLKFIVETNPLVESITHWHRCASAGATGDRMVMYVPSPEKLDVRIPVEFETLPPEQRGLNQVITCHARYGGVVVYYPGSMLYIDQI